MDNERVDRPSDRLERDPVILTAIVVAAGIWLAVVGYALAVWLFS